ncbi:MAG: AmmeMemoRadiSam system protein B [Deltaproteobacteria bacterium]|nr:AmmeMemoRadiSam system protein B [Deltaproteobacteria bacterium]
MFVRKPSVAGQFYPADVPTLIDYLDRYIPKDLPKEKALAIMAPHAGYIYSGHVAGKVYGRISIPDDIVIMGPSHTGLGANFALMDEGIWEMPQGSVSINKTLADLILSEGKFTKDTVAHQYEHSLEVQLPFLQYLKKQFRFVPIVLSYTDFSTCEELGKALAKAISNYNKPVLIISSSDMTHYESQSSAEKKDRMAIKKILALDPYGLYETVRENHITMCGVIPTTVALVASNLLGAGEAELVSYATSGDVTGDYYQVVGYAGIIIK